MVFDDVLPHIGVSMQQIIIAGIIIVVGYILGKLIKQFIFRISESTGIRQKLRFGIEKEAKKFGFNIDFIYMLGLTIKYAVYLIAIFFALKTLQVEFDIGTVIVPLITYMPNVIAAVIIVVLGSAVIELLADITKYKIRDEIDENAERAGLSNLSTTLASYVRYFLYTVIFLTAVLQLGIRAESILAFILIVGGIMLGAMAALFVLSMKDHLQNITSGMQLRSQNVITKGDRLLIGDIGGNVEEIGLSATLLKNKNVLHYIPNSNLIKNGFSIIKQK